MGIPNREHDSDCGAPYLRFREQLVSPMRNVKVSALSGFTSAKNGIQNRHSNDRDREAEDTLPPNHFDRLYGVFGHDELFEDELCGGKELGKSDQ